MANADIMREKQRRAELKAQGIDPDAQDKPKKEYDQSWMKQYEVPEDEEETEEEVPVEQAQAAAA